MKRNSFLVAHAFHNYLKAALLSSACMQLTVIIDAMVAGHFIGPDALTVINLSIPLITFATAVSTLIGIGPAIMAAKAIGKRQTEKVNSIFSSALYQAIVIGIIQIFILYMFLPYIGKSLCSNEQLLPILMEYLQVLPLTLFVLMIVYTLISLVEADGCPHVATKAVAWGSILNVIFDVILVACFEIGVTGLAIAMLINYLVALLYFLFRMKKKEVSYQWSRPNKSIINLTKAGVKEGMPIMINDLLYSLMLFGVNTLLLNFYSEDELYYWAIFLQIILLIMVIVDSAEGAILSIGNILKSEDDRFGLHVLVKRIWLLLGGIVLFVAIVISIFPIQVALLFSNRSDISENWPQILRILSLMLVPYALTTFMRSLFQVLGKKICGILFSFGQFAITVTAIYIFAKWHSQLIWWSFPIAAWLLFAIQIIYLLTIRNREHIKGFSIIPTSPKMNFLDLSVAYNNEAVKDAIQSVCSFLQEHKINQLIEMEVNICCEELMTNIVLFQTYKTRSYMDLYVAIEKERIFFTLKDSGRPFNPVLTKRPTSILESPNCSLGLYLINRVCTNITHKYMYGLNVIFAEFEIKDKK